MAGDGKLAAILEPNDGRCHLNANMLYSKSSEMVRRRGTRGCSFGGSVKRHHMDALAVLCDASELVPRCKVKLTLKFKHLAVSVAPLAKPINSR